MVKNKKKHNWQKISREYIEADSDAVRPTLKDLASKYKVSFGYIQQVSQRDGWVKQSKIYTRSVEDKLRAGKIEAFAKEQASFDTQCLQLSKALFSQVSQHFIKAVSDSEPIKPTALNNLANVISVGQKIGRTALGMYDVDDETMMDKLERKGYKTIDPTIAQNEA
jgi:hypothetical protein